MPEKRDFLPSDAAKTVTRSRVVDVGGNKMMLAESQLSPVFLLRFCLYRLLGDKYTSSVVIIFFTVVWQRRGIPMNAIRCGERSGFTLAEVMVGMSVLALSLVAAFGLVNQTIRMIRPSREATLSMQAAQIEMERLRSSWADFAALGERTTVGSAGNPALAALDGGRAIIHKTPYTGVFSNAPVFSVAIEVNWQRQNGDTGTNVLVGVIGERGIVR